MVLFLNLGVKFAEDSSKEIFRIGKVLVNFFCAKVAKRKHI